MAAVRRVPWEVRAVLVLLLLDGAAVIATYSRFPPSELYHVYHSGIAAGFGRELVALNFPFALIAIAVVGLTWPRLQGRPLRLAGVVALAMCAVVYFAVDQADLDAKPLNAVPAVGVALAFALALAGGVPSVPRLLRGDKLRIAIATVLVFFCAPLIAAELGFFLDGVPLLGWIFQTGAVAPEPGAGYLHATVHHGHHHGLDGFLLVTTALLLSRLLGGICRPWMRTLVAAILSLMLVYGLANMVNDLWIEQVVKRGWTSWQVPDVLEPAVSLAWAALLIAAALCCAFFFSRRPLLGGRR